MTLNVKSNYRWVILVISFLLMLTFALSLQVLPPIFQEIMEDIPFSNSQAGMLMGAYAIPGIFLPFLIAFLANRFNKKHIILIALATLIAGMIAFSSGGSFASLLIYRLVAGIGATALVVLAPLLVTMFFDEKNMGVAMGIFNIAVPAGTVIAANLFGALGAVVQWRYLILGIAAFAGLVLVISLFTLKLPEDRNMKEASDSKDEGITRFRPNLSTCLLALIWAITNAQLLSHVTFSSQYFQNFGMTASKAGFLTSLIMLIPIFICPMLGILIDKTGWKKQLLLVGSVILAISFGLISRSATPASLWIWAIGIGIGISPIPVLVFAMLPDVVAPRHMGMGLGMLTCASNLGIASGPWAFGLILDITKESFSIGFVILGLASIITIFIITRLRVGRRSIN